MVTTYEKAGIKKGIKKGMEKGKLVALMLLLENRFAKLPDDVRRKVERIESSQRIEELLVAVLNAKSLSELGL